VVQLAGFGFTTAGAAASAAFFAALRAASCASRLAARSFASASKLLAGFSFDLRGIDQSVAASESCRAQAVASLAAASDAALLGRDGRHHGLASTKRLDASNLKRRHHLLVRLGQRPEFLRQPGEKIALNVRPGS